MSESDQPSAYRPTEPLPLMEQSPGERERQFQQAPGLELMGEFEGSGFKEPRFLVKREDGQMVQLTDLLYILLQNIDGTRSPDQIAERVSSIYGRKVSADNVRQLVSSSLEPQGLVTSGGARAAPRARPDPLLRLKLRTTILPERVVNALAVMLRPLFWPPVVIAALAGLVAVDVWYFGRHGVGQSLREMIYEPMTLLLIWAGLVLSVLWHELGHATACRYSGARPREIGFGIYIIWPAFYTDVTDIYSAGKAGRVRTDLGGVYFNALFSIAIAGVYLVTGFEPVLVLILIQHILMLYQFMPFLRLDGYYVIADLTGVPDLFSRIQPVVKGALPGRETPRRVRELKPWVRVVVTIWVATAVPVLLYLLVMMVIAAPRLLATAWDSVQEQWRVASNSWGEGGYARAISAGLQAGLVTAPVAGIAVTSSRVAKRVGSSWWSLTSSRPLVGGTLGVAGIAGLIGAGLLLLPNGEYRPIQPGERWTLSSGMEALGEVTSGRPGLSESQQERLGGAPFRSEEAEEQLPSQDETQAPPDSPAPTPASSYEEESEEPSPPTPTPEETFSAEPTPTPS